MKVKPIKDMVLLRLDMFEKMVGGIILPESSTEKRVIPVVVAIGEKADIGDIKVGDKVVTTQYTGTPWTVDNKPYIIIPDTEIIAKLED